MPRVQECLLVLSEHDEAMIPLLTQQLGCAEEDLPQVLLEKALDKLELDQRLFALSQQAFALRDEGEAFPEPSAWPETLQAELKQAKTAPRDARRKQEEEVQPPPHKMIDRLREMTAQKRAAMREEAEKRAKKEEKKAKKEEKQQEKRQEKKQEPQTVKKNGSSTLQPYYPTPALLRRGVEIAIETVKEWNENKANICPPALDIDYPTLEKILCKYYSEPPIFRPEQYGVLWQNPRWHTMPWRDPKIVEGLNIRFPGPDARRKRIENDPLFLILFAISMHLGAPPEVAGEGLIHLAPIPYPNGIECWYVGQPVPDRRFE